MNVRSELLHPPDKVAAIPPSHHHVVTVFIPTINCVGFFSLKSSMSDHFKSYSNCFGVNIDLESFSIFYFQTFPCSYILSSTLKNSVQLNFILRPVCQFVF